MNGLSREAKARITSLLILAATVRQSKCDCKRCAVVIANCETAIENIMSASRSGGIVLEPFFPALPRWWQN